MGTSINRVCMMSTFRFLCTRKMIDRRRAGAEKKAATRPPSVYWWMVLVIWTNGPRSSHLITKSHPTRTLSLFLLRVACSPPLSLIVIRRWQQDPCCVLSERILSPRRTLLYFANCGQTWRASPADNAPLWFPDSKSLWKNTTSSSIFQNWAFRRCWKP